MEQRLSIKEYFIIKTNMHLSKSRVSDPLIYIDLFGRSGVYQKFLTSKDEIRGAYMFKLQQTQGGSHECKFMIYETQIM